MRSKRNILKILIAATILFIWTHSMMPSDLSGSESGFITGLITPFLECVLGKGHVTEHLVRKIAHFSEYFLLGSEIMLYMHTISSESIPKAVNIGLIIAFLDETIQIFSGRGPMIADVWIDLAGFTAASALIRLFLYALKRRNK